ncbi:unnamed protein product [Ostreobium quekettii]|uniref:Uncharacterized protein n=1 Tax=Ostreobium quekettii TaxID=121088 RepID=A0A8S1IL79_9CHLO|nr:unnamed protein product [Ostreobium quekettii]
MPKAARRKRHHKPPFVPYARGFKTPTHKQSAAALGSPPPGTRDFMLGVGFFTAVPRPICPNDWLAQYSEDGQSYADFLASCPWLSGPRWKVPRSQPFDPAGAGLPGRYPGAAIYLAGLGDFSKQAETVAVNPRMSELMDFAGAFFCVPMRELTGLRLDVGRGKAALIPAPGSRIRVQEIRCRFHRGSGRTQLHAPSLLKALVRALPHDAICLMALTTHDLFDGEGDLFVAGMAAGASRVGTFSLARYDPAVSFSPEHWHGVTLDASAPAEARRETILRRACKLMAHEVGHLLGLEHCVWHACLMNGSGHLEEDDRQPMALCPVDLRKLQALGGFDVPGRYKRLLAVMKNLGMRAEASWVGRRLEFLEG